MRFILDDLLRAEGNVQILSNSLFWVVLLGLATLFATIVAPRLGRRGKLSGSIDQVINIRRKARHDKIAVSYSVDGNLIEDDIFVVEGTLKNTGWRDIVRDDFRDPIGIAVPNGTTLLSIDVKSSANAKAEGWERDGKVELIWDLLKKREQVQFSAICSISEGNTPEKKDFEIEARLVDIDSKKAVGARIVPATLALAAMFLTMYLPLFYLADIHKADFVRTVDGNYEPILFSDNFESFRICKQKNSRFVIRDCDPEVDFDGDFSRFGIAETVIGIRPLAFVVPGVVTVAYWALGMLYLFVVRPKIRERSVNS